MVLKGNILLYFEFDFDKLLFIYLKIMCVDI